MLPRTLALLLPLIICISPALAEGDQQFTVYRGQGVDSDLLDMPGGLVGSELTYDSTYFTAIGYYVPTRSPGWLAGPFRYIGVSGFNTGLEVIAVQHEGLQHNFEADLAYSLRTGRAFIGPVSVRFGFAVGLSYAFGTPSYEDGPIDDPGRRYRLQNYEAYELDWALSGYPKLQLVTRVHHRSGIYGLIAPRRVGSNFVTTGLRITLP